MFAPLLVMDTLLFVFLATRSRAWRWLATCYSVMIPLLTVALFTLVILGMALPMAKIVDQMN